jgi:DNA-binding transcriptional MocR family regulator
MGLKLLEVPSTPREGMSLEALGYAIRHEEVRACIAISNFNNPLGTLMSDAKKRELVRLLATRGIPLIEDDVYGDLCFGRDRPPAFKAYDEEGLVLLCSSFSKTLAPGYRVGWIVPGRFQEMIEERKSLFNIATATPPQLAIAEFLSDGGYDRHLRATRRILRDRMMKVRESAIRHFPQGTRFSQPEGGFVLWAEMPEGIDSLELYRRAHREGIGLAPGLLFTTGDGFGNCVRLNCSFWSERIERSLETVGRLAGTSRSGR